MGYSLTPRTHRVDGFPVLRLLCPFRLLMKTLGFRWGLPYLLSILLIILHEVSCVHNGGLERDDVGGVFLAALLSALCGSPDCSQGRSGLPVIPPCGLYGFVWIVLLLLAHVEVSALWLTR